MRIPTILFFILLALPAHAQYEWIDLGGPVSGPGSLLVGTQEGTFYRTADLGEDILLSTDGGETWQSTDYPGGEPRSLDAGADGSILVAADRVWRFQNGEWTDLGLEGEHPRRVTADNQGRLFALIGEGQQCESKFSINNGETWQSRSIPTDGIPFGHCRDGIVTSSGSVLVIRRTSVIQGYENTMMLSMITGGTWVEIPPNDMMDRLVLGQYGGVFLISTWHVPQNGPTFQPSLRRYGQGGTWTELLDVNFSTVGTLPDGRVVIGYLGHLETLDGEVFGAVPSPQHIASASSGELFVSTSQSGNFRYDGELWRQVSGNRSPIWSIFMNENEVSVTTNGAVFNLSNDHWQVEWSQTRPADRTTMDGENWYAVDGTFGMMGLWRDSSQTQVPIYVDYYGDGYDYPCVETCMTPAIVSIEDTLLVSIAGQDEMDIVNSEFAGIYRSTDRGETWINTLHGMIACTMTTHGDMILASTGYCEWGWPYSTHGVVRSMDGGNTWETLEEGLPEQESYGANHLHISDSGTAYLRWRNEVYRLENDVWVPMGLNANTASMTTSANDRLVVVTNGIVKAYDGINWVYIGRPDGHDVRVIARDANGRLYAGTDWGVFASDGPFTVSAETDIDPQLTVLKAPYPNPAVRQSTVPFTLSTTAAVRLSLYDLLGRRIAVLDEGVRESGSHEIAIDLSLASGTYLILLETEGMRFTQRLSWVGQ